MIPMCYSAMVKQSIKQLGLTYQARVQLDAFEELFELRAKGSGAKIPRAMELSFGKPENAQEKRIWKLIEIWHAHQIETYEKELFEQRKRLGDAEQKIKLKETKVALNEKRISSEKILKLKARLKDLSRDIPDEYARIFPHMVSPLMIEKNDERIIMPFRYHLRPFGQEPEFDRKFDGTYNARRDRLREVFWWKSIFGKNHGVLVISKFWENISLSRYEHRSLKKGEVDQNIVLEFKPEGLSEMLIPCIFDHNQSGEFSLNSFALITDEPNPEIAAAGHDRTPILMKEEHLDRWLKTSGKSLRDFEVVFDDKQPSFFEHSIASGI